MIWYPGKNIKEALASQQVQGTSELDRLRAYLQTECRKVKGVEPIVDFIFGPTEIYEKFMVEETSGYLVREAAQELCDGTVALEWWNGKLYTIKMINVRTYS